MGMFSFLKAPKTIDKMLDAVIKGGDALVFTAEEKAEFNQKASEIYLKHMELVGKESSPTSMSRRIIAILVVSPFVFLTLGSALLDLAGKPEIANHWQELAMTDYSSLVLAVVVFYFGTHVLGKLKG